MEKPWGEASTVAGRETWTAAGRGKENGEEAELGNSAFVLFGKG